MTYKTRDDGERGVQKCPKLRDVIYGHTQKDRSLKLIVTSLIDNPKKYLVRNSSVKPELGLSLELPATSRMLTDVRVIVGMNLLGSDQ